MRGASINTDTHRHWLTFRGVEHGRPARRKRRAAKQIGPQKGAAADALLSGDLRFHSHDGPPTGRQAHNLRLIHANGRPVFVRRPSAQPCHWRLCVAADRFRSRDALIASGRRRHFRPSVWPAGRGQIAIDSLSCAEAGRRETIKRPGRRSDRVKSLGSAHKTPGERRAFCAAGGHDRGRPARRLVRLAWREHEIGVSETGRPAEEKPAGRPANSAQDSRGDLIFCLIL